MDSSPARSVVIEREMPFPPEKVWRALTEGALIREWLLENDFRPVVGHQFQFRNKPLPGWDGVINCEVLVVEPNWRLSYRWEALGLLSVVAFTLSATQSGTLIRMEQSGFQPEQKAEFGGARYGWQKFIVELERIVAAL